LALCLWITLAASASCWITKSFFLVLANSSASFRSLASSASYDALVESGPFVRPFSPG
jgi:hypothetical protein